MKIDFYELEDKHYLLYDKNVKTYQQTIKYNYNYILNKEVKNELKELIINHYYNENIYYKKNYPYYNENIYYQKKYIMIDYFFVIEDKIFFSVIVFYSTKSRKIEDTLYFQCEKNNKNLKFIDNYKYIQSLKEYINIFKGG